MTGRRSLATSDHVRALTDRLEKLVPVESTAPLVGRTLRLLEEATAVGQDVVMSAHWHGDLTPWNAARDDEGRLWCWDWESTEPDAVAGLDAVHWHLSVVQEAGEPLTAQALATAAEAARPALTGLGHGRRSVPVVVAVYVASMVERAIALSVAEGGWEAGWLTVDNLEDLVGHAAQGLVAR